MDGRDIGTVVLPNATVKIYLTASAEARANRRYKELLEKGTNVTYNEVYDDMVQRDYNDMNREIAPLKQADDAVLADTSDCNLEESLALLLKIVKENT
jgi:cytidylate kinase